MKKLLLLCSLSLFIATGLQAEIKQHTTFPHVLYNEGVDVSSPKDKTLLGWDLNSVVFTKNIWGNLPSMLNHVYQKKGIGYTAWVGSQFFWLWREKKALKKAGDNRGFVWDAMFTDVEKRGKTEAEKATNKELVGFLRNFSQQANDLEGYMAELLHDLNQKGHRNAVLSNMGQGLLDVQIEKIEAQHPKPNESVSHVLDFLKDDQHKMIAAEDNGWMHKPDANIYEEFFKKNFDYNNGVETGVQNNRDNSDSRIFIDDKETNCRAALKNGFDIAIICKDQQKIKPTLQALGVTGLEEKQKTN